MAEEQISSNGIVCPYCLKLNRDVSDFLHDEEVPTEAECGHCGHTFTVIVMTITTYTSTP